jgi:AAA family ATP:ADP antiporter
VDTVKRVLQNGTESQVVHMLQKTLEVRDERFFTSVKALLEHPSAKIRLLALENLYFLKSENLSLQIEEMVNDPDQQVTTSAFRYLLKNYRNDRVELFNKYLNSEDVTISNAALIGLSRELRNNHFSQDQFNLEQQIKAALNKAGQLASDEEKLNKLLASLEAIGNARMAVFYPLLATHLTSTDPLVLPTAIKSASKTLDPQFIDAILSHLSRKETRKYAIEGLFHYGSPIIEVIKQKIKSEEIDLDDAPFAVNIIEKFASQKCVNALIDLTDDTEHSVKIAAIDAIKRLKWKHTQLRVNESLVVNKILDECQLYQNTLAVIHSQIVIAYRRKDRASETEAVTQARNGLIQLLEQRLDRQLQRIFRFLGIKYRPNDVDPILNSILNGKEEQRLHAIEFLDNILNKELKKELIPVAESILIDVTSEEMIQKLNLKVYSEEECYNALLNRKDMKLKQAVLYLIEQTGNPKFVPLVQLAAKDNNERVRNKAAEVLKVISG